MSHSVLLAAIAALQVTMSVHIKLYKDAVIKVMHVAAINGADDVDVFCNIQWSSIKIVHTKIDSIVHAKFGISNSASNVVNSNSAWKVEFRKSCIQKIKF